VLKELSDDRSLERFKIEYEKLFKALKKSHGESPCETSSCTAVLMGPGSGGMECATHPPAASVPLVYSCTRHAVSNVILYTQA
jgi:hypothetical protein